MADDKPKSSKKAKSSSKKEGTASAQSTPKVVKFGRNVEIYPQSPLAEYDSGANKAYKAVSHGKSSDSLFAIICERDVIPRRQAASVYAALINPGLVPVLSYGKVYWPPAKQERYVFIYRDVLGKRLLPIDATKAMGWKQDFVLDVIVKPMVDILQDFRDKDFVHGAIRPTNMFDGGSSGVSQKFILGDCLSTQASYSQPSLFEPVERAQADPVSRGTGVLADDIYAFGVSLAVMMRSSDPLEGKSEADVIREKVLLGSYAAVTGKDRFKGSILELLRGLLHDDPAQRWTVEEIMIWLDGRRLSPKQALPRKKAARPFSYCGEKFLQPQLLAMSLGAVPSETVRIVEDGTLEQWLTRSLEDEQGVERLAEAYQMSIQAGRGAGYEDRLVTNVTSILDTTGPLRFRGRSMSGDGVGAALYEAIVLNQDINDFANMFVQSLAMNWVSSTENPTIDVGAIISKFDACKNFLRHNKMGFGIERCVYVLAPEAPCLSPKLKDYYISTPEDMMYAFESLCEKGESPALFLDRHSAAFLSVKDDKAIDSYLFDLNAAEDYKNLLGNLKCLATLQKRGKLKPFPHIAKVFGKRLSVVYKRYHDKSIRDKLKTNIERFIKAGDLVKMATLLDSPEVQQKDFKAFREAMYEYAELKRESEMLSRKLENEGSFGRGTGKEFAALISGGLAALVIIVTTFMFLSDKSIF